MKKLSIILLLILSFNSESIASWSQEKTAREIIFAVSLSNDYRQTMVIARTPWRKEKNKILGKRPHKDNVNIYFSGCLVGHALIAYMLPEPYAAVWQNVWVGIETNSTRNNEINGHKIDFDIKYNLSHTICF